MAIKSLKGLRRKQAHDLLQSQGYSIITHRHNRVNLEMLFQICLNRIAQLQSQPINKVYHQIVKEKSRVNLSTRVNPVSDNPEKIDELVVSLLYGNPEQNVHNVQESDTPYNPEDIDDNTNNVD